MVPTLGSDRPVGNLYILTVPWRNSVASLLFFQTPATFGTKIIFCLCNGSNDLASEAIAKGAKVVFTLLVSIFNCRFFSSGLFIIILQSFFSSSRPISSYAEDTKGSCKKFRRSLSFFFLLSSNGSI